MNNQNALNKQLNYISFRISYDNPLESQKIDKLNQVNENQITIRHNEIDDNKSKSHAYLYSIENPYFSQKVKDTLVSLFENGTFGAHDDTVKTSGSSSSIATIFSIWSCTIGSGLLCLPWAVKQAGIIPSIYIMIIYGLIIYYTATIYIKTGLRAKDFYALVEKYFGKKYGHYGRVLELVGSVLLSCGTVLIYFVIIK